MAASVAATTAAAANSVANVVENVVEDVVDAVSGTAAAEASAAAAAAAANAVAIAAQHAAGDALGPVEVYDETSQADVSYAVAATDAALASLVLTSEPVVLTADAILTKLDSEAIGRDQSTDGLRDDFDLLIADPRSELALERPDSNVPAVAAATDAAEFVGDAVAVAVNDAFIGAASEPTSLSEGDSSQFAGTGFFGDQVDRGEMIAVVGSGDPRDAISSGETELSQIVELVETDAFDDFTSGIVNSEVTESAADEVWDDLGR